MLPTAAMTDEQLSFFRTLLTERARALVEEAETAPLPGSVVDEADVLDEAETTQTEFALRLRDREKAMLAKLRRAIERLEDGDYGLCVACGDDITLKRLVARPTALHCIDCRSRETFLPMLGAW